MSSTRRSPVTCACARADVSLFGDAAHLMPPFTGRGANLAMLDAVNLADNLTIGKYSDVTQALSAYETTMFARMTAAITEVLADQDVFIAPDAPARVEDVFRQRIAMAQQRRTGYEGADAGSQVA
jgi:2-polyprenyl-6-methoxyphenol hydroxylase-like FAD-dependent oxidoreductase